MLANVWTAIVVVVCLFAFAYSLHKWIESVRANRDKLDGDPLPYPLNLHSRPYPAHVVPSAADLDAVAQEQQIRLATSVVENVSAGKAYLQRRNGQVGFSSPELMWYLFAFMAGVMIMFLICGPSAQKGPAEPYGLASRPTWEAYNALLVGRAHDTAEIHGLQERVDRYEADAQTATVLYDASGAQSPLEIPLWHGLVKVSIAGIGSAALGPRWVIPSRVHPYVIGYGVGGAAVYSYLDLRTRAVSATYLAGPPPAQTSAEDGQ